MVLKPSGSQKTKHKTSKGEYEPKLTWLTSVDRNWKELNETTTRTVDNEIIIY